MIEDSTMEVIHIRLEQIEEALSLCHEHLCDEAYYKLPEHREDEFDPTAARNFLKRFPYYDAALQLVLESLQKLVEDTELEKLKATEQD